MASKTKAKAKRKAVRKAVPVQAPKCWRISLMLIGGREIMFEVASQEERSLFVAVLRRRENAYVTLPGGMEICPGHVSAFNVTGPFEARTPTA